MSSSWKFDSSLLDPAQRKDSSQFHQEPDECYHNKRKRTKSSTRGIGEVATSCSKRGSKVATAVLKKFLDRELSLPGVGRATLANVIIRKEGPDKITGSHSKLEHEIRKSNKKHERSCNPSNPFCAMLRQQYQSRPDSKIQHEGMQGEFEIERVSPMSTTRNANPLMRELRDQESSK